MALFIAVGFRACIPAEESCPGENVHSRTLKTWQRARDWLIRRAHPFSSATRFSVSDVFALPREQ